MLIDWVEYETGWRCDARLVDESSFSKCCWVLAPGLSDLWCRHVTIGSLLHLKMLPNHRSLGSWCVCRCLHPLHWPPSSWVDVVNHTQHCLHKHTATWPHDCTASYVYDWITQSNHTVPLVPKALAQRFAVDILQIKFCMEVLLLKFGTDIYRELGAELLYDICASYYSKREGNISTNFTIVQFIKSL